MGTQIRDLGQAIESHPRSSRGEEQRDRGPLNPMVIGRAAYVRPHQPTMEELDAARIDAQATFMTHQTAWNRRKAKATRDSLARRKQQAPTNGGGRYYVPGRGWVARGASEQLPSKANAFDDSDDCSKSEDSNPEGMENS